MADIRETKSSPASVSQRVLSADGKSAIQTTVEYYENDKGEKIKATRVVQMICKKTVVNKAVAARKKWAKFGDCAGLPSGAELSVTQVSHEVFDMDFKPKQREEAQQDDVLTGFAKSKLGQGSIVQCRNCGQAGHFTRHCTLAPRAGIAPEAPPPEDAPSGPGGKGVYVPPSQRGKGPGGQGQRDDGFSLRVTNLPEETTKEDLEALFREYGHTTRVYVSPPSGANGVYAYVSYATKECAERALGALHKHLYGNLVMHVEWSKPKAR